MSAYDNLPAMMRGLSHYRGRREGDLAWLDDRDWMDLPDLVDHAQADAVAADEKPRRGDAPL